MNIGDIKARLTLDSAQFNTQISKAKSNLKDTGNQAKATAKDFGQLESALSGIGSGVALAGLKTAIIGVVAEAQKLNNALTGLKSVSDAFGVSANGAKEAAKKLAEDGLAPVSTYATALKSLLSTGIGLDKAVDLINVYKDRAAFGKSETISFSQAVENLAQTFKTESSELGDLSGMTENYSKILETGLRIMQQRGMTQAKNVDQLNELERAEAKYLATVQMSQPFIGDAQKLTEGYAGKQAELNAKFIEAKQALGEAYTPAVQEIIEALIPAIEETTDFISANKEMIAGVTASSATILGLSTVILTVIPVINTLRTAALALYASLGPIGVAIAVIGVAASALYSYKSAADAVAESTYKLESQQRNSFIQMANNAEALEKKISTLKQGTDEHTRASNMLKQVYDQIIATNPDLRTGFENQGKSVQWLKGEVRKLSAEYVALQKNAFNAAFATMNGEVAQKRQAMSNAQAEIALFEGKDLDVNLKKQLENKKQELSLLKNDIVGIQQQQYKLYQEYRNVLDPKPITGDQVIAQMTPSPRTSPTPTSSISPGGRGSSSSGGKSAAEIQSQVAQNAYQNALALENARIALRKAKGEDEEKLLKGHIANLNKIYKSHLGYLNGHEQEKLQLFTQAANATEELRQVQLKKEHEQFQHSVDWINEKKTKHELSLQEELAAYERVMNRYAEGTEERKQAEREYYRVKFDLLEKERKETIDNLNEEKKTRIDSLDRQERAVLDSIARQRKAFESSHREKLESLKEEEKAEIESIARRRDAYEKEYRDRIKMIDEETQRKIEAIEAELDLLDEGKKEDERDIQDQEFQSNKERLLEEIKRYEMDKTLSSRKQLSDAKMELEKIEADYAKLLRDREREDRRKDLQEEIDSIRENADKKKDVLKDEYDTKKEAFDREIEETKEHYANLEEEATDLYERKIELFDQEVEATKDRYTQLEEDAKKHYDNLIKQVEEYVATANTKIGQIRSSVPSGGVSNSGGNGGSSSGGSSLLDQMRRNSDSWHDASPAERERLANENRRLGESQGWSRSSDGVWRDRNGNRVYHTGGIAGMMNFASGDALLPDEISAILRRGEPVLTGKQIGSLVSHVKNDNSQPIYIDKVEVRDGKNFVEDLHRAIGGRTV